MAAVLVVPEFRQWAGLDGINPPNTPKQTPPTSIPSTQVHPTQAPPAPTLTATVEYICPFSKESDEATIKNLIEIESIAAINEDLSMLGLVYFPNAIITDQGETWNDPIEHYKWVFAKFTILTVRNSNIRIEFTSSDIAVAHRTSSGRTTNKIDQVTDNYTDDSGQLIFMKDNNDCWRIYRFDKAPNCYK